MAKILITGGSGFIGTNLVQYCLDRGDEVLNLDIARPKNPALAGTMKRVDILDARELKEAICDFDPKYIVHLAARTDLNGKSIEDYKANTIGVRNLIEVASCVPSLKRVVFASSMYVCRLGYVPQHDSDYCPNTYYGESKALGERVVRECAGGSFVWVIVRPTSIWGPWFDVPYKGFFAAVRKGIYFHPRGHQIKRSYGFVLNVVFQLVGLISPQLESNRVHAKTFYLADYEPVDIKQWADTIAAAFGRSKAREVPLLLLRLAATGGDLLKRLGVPNPPLTSFRLDNLITPAVFDMSAVRSLCGESPYTLEEGVRLTVDWIRRSSFLA